MSIRENIRLIARAPLIATTPIYSKNPLNILLQNQNANDLGAWCVALGMWALPSLQN